MHHTWEVLPVRFRTSIFWFKLKYHYPRLHLTHTHTHSIHMLILPATSVFVLMPFCYLLRKIYSQAKHLSCSEIVAITEKCIRAGSMKLLGFVPAESHKTTSFYYTPLPLIQAVSAWECNGSQVKEQGCCSWDLSQHTAGPIYSL